MIFNPEESTKAQTKLCEEKGLPHFAPKDGICWNCRMNIYTPIEREGWNGASYTSGISTEKASNELVTGCPHCNRTYCD